MTQDAPPAEAQAQPREPAPPVDATILAPISETTPAGRDLTYDPHLEKLASEVEKVTSIAGEQPDWGFVRREAARMLQKETKDLRLASWWAAAGAFAVGWAAAAEGVATYTALANQYWADMYPPVKRLRARAGLVEWLWENLAKAIGPRTVNLADGDAVRALEAAVTALDKAMVERLGDSSPGLGSLRGVLREKVRSIPEPATEAPAAAAATPGSPAAARASLPAGAAAPAEVAAVGSIDEAETLANRWRDSLSTLARHARLAAPTSPWPYRLARVSAWLTIEAAPDVENGKTFVRAPRDRATLADLFDSSAWEALREAAEDGLSEHIFWLDLHRYSAIALERLGPTFAAARAAVGRETSALIERIPSLPSLLFTNGTPFAAPETVDWLNSERAKTSGSTGGGANTAMTDMDEALKKTLAECEARAQAGQVDEALSQAIHAAQAATSVAARFRGRLAVAQLAHRSGKEKIAMAMLEGLLAEVDPTLEAWEPGVSAAVLEALLKVLRAVSPEDGDRQTLLFRRLLRLDPSAAMRMGG